eukprot:11351483-Heterocapsa_arctica.AAC.1
MNAGVLHAIITDGVWYPERANKRGKNEDGLCLLCKRGKQGGLQHIWWECEACNSVTNYNWLQLQKILKQNDELRTTMPLDNGSHHQRIYRATRYGLHEGGRLMSGLH